MDENTKGNIEMVDSSEAKVKNSSSIFPLISNTSKFYF